MRSILCPGPTRAVQINTWRARIGMGGMAFFLLKGLLWLLAPALVSLLR